MGYSKARRPNPVPFLITESKNMGALDYLKEFKGKVLDASSYQLLERNYELQEENNKQLKERGVDG
jgi:hypothetical protein